MRVPPKKKQGIATGRRRLTGALLDVSAAAEFLGMSEKTVRSRASNHLLPYRRFGGRIVFLQREIAEFLPSLPGCGLDEARENCKALHQE